MKEEVDGVQKAILRGYTMLALYIVKEYVDDCNKKGRKPKDVGMLFKALGLEGLSDKMSLRLMRR